MTRNQRKLLTVYLRWRVAQGRQTRSPSNPTGAVRAVRGQPRPASRPQYRPCPPPAQCQCQPPVMSRPKIRGQLSLTSQWPAATRRWAAPLPSSSRGWICWPPHQSSPPYLPPAPMTQVTPPSALQVSRLLQASCLLQGALQAPLTLQRWRTRWTPWLVTMPTWPGWAWRAPPLASPRATWSCWSPTGCTQQQQPQPGPGWGCQGPALGPLSLSWLPTPRCWRGRGAWLGQVTQAPVLPCPLWPAPATLPTPSPASPGPRLCPRAWVCLVSCLPTSHPWGPWGPPTSRWRYTASSGAECESKYSIQKSRYSVDYCQS